MTPTARTLAALRRRGLEAQVVERWVPYARRRIDLFGFIDLIYLEPGRGIVGVQATTGAHLTNRIEKIHGPCARKAVAWMSAGGWIEVWGWRKIKLHRGSKAVRWKADVREVNAIALTEDR